MNPIIPKIQEYIQDPLRTTSMSIYWPRRKPLSLPVPPEVVDAEEARLGFPLPNLLREMFINISNGGFGPGYGMVGLSGGFSLYDGGGKAYNIVEYYFLYRHKPNNPELNHDFKTEGNTGINYGEWFDKLVPICSWGCHHESLIDCSKTDSPAIHFIGNGGELSLEYESFEGWIDAWLRGEDLWKI